MTVKMGGKAKKPKVSTIFGDFACYLADWSQNNRSIDRYFGSVSKVSQAYNLPRRASPSLPLDLTDASIQLFEDSDSENADALFSYPTKTPSPWVLKSLIGDSRATVKPPSFVQDVAKRPPSPQKLLPSKMPKIDNDHESIYISSDVRGRHR